MIEKINTLLQSKFVGTRKDVLLHLARTLSLQVSTDDEAQALIDKLTDEKVKEFVKDFRAEIDKEVSESTKTFEMNLKKKFDFVEKQATQPTNPDNGGGAPKTNEPNAEYQKLIESINLLQQKITSFESQNQQKTRSQILSEKLATCKDEVFKGRILKDFGRMSFNSDDEFNEYISETVADIETANQNAINLGLANSGRPWVNGGSTSKKATDDELNEIVKGLSI